MIAAVWKTVSTSDDGRGHVVGVGDVAGQRLQPRVLGERGWHAVERDHVVPTVEQLGDEVGADEAGASGYQDAAELGGQCWITHGGEHN